MCPSCRIPKAGVDDLGELPPQFHCDTCGIFYTVDVDRHRPHASEDALHLGPDDAVGLEELARAESDDVARDVCDREHQPPAEPVVALLAALIGFIGLGLDQHAGLDQPVLAELVEGALQSVAAVGGEAEAETVAQKIRDENTIAKTAGQYFRLEPMKQHLVNEVRPAILALMGAVIFLLLIAMFGSENSTCRVIDLNSARSSSLFEVPRSDRHTH